MNKKDKEGDVFNQISFMVKSIKSSYLWRLISKFLSVACTIILIVLVVVGSLMFYFNTKAKAYKNKGIEYTPPFGLYTIISGSMEPNVEVYDVVIARDYDISKLKVGDIITFISNWDINYGVTVTHRVVGISKNEKGEYQLSTKGDNNATKDGGTVTQMNLIGKVVGRLPQLGRLQFFLATKMGWFMVVFVPALAVIVFDMIKIFKLYVLKNQIDNVKTTKEVEEEKLSRELENKEKERIEHKNVVLPKRDNKEMSSETKAIELPLTVKKDENIDTVELPKISSTGKITENTAELPNLNVEKNTREETKSFRDIVLPDDVEVQKKEMLKDTMIPLVKKSNAETPKPDVERRQILRRKND